MKKSKANILRDQRIFDAREAGERFTTISAREGISYGLANTIYWKVKREKERRAKPFGTCSARVRHGLQNARVRDHLHLLHWHSPRSLLMTHGFGKASLRELKEHLHKHGLLEEWKRNCDPDDWITNIPKGKYEELSTQWRTF